MKYNILKSLSSSSENFINKIENTINSPENVVLVSLFVAVLETMKDLTILLENDRFQNIPAVARIAIESYVDFKLLAKDSNQIYSLLIKTGEGEVRKIKGLLEEQGLSNVIIANLNERKSAIEQENAERKTFMTSMALPVLDSIKKKFEAIDMLQDYKTVYSELSGYTHNDINTIEKRHISMLSDTRIRLSTIATFDIKVYESLIFALSVYYLDMLRILNDKLCMNEENNILQLEAQIVSYRAEIERN